MLEQLFHYPKVLANHRKAPMLIEREQFLQHCVNQGMAPSTLMPIANELRVIAQRLDIISTTEQKIKHEQINIAAKRWAKHQRRQGRCRSLRWSHKRFVQVATGWLAFMGRLEIEKLQNPVGEKWIEPFTTYMRDERGLSAHTIHSSRWHMEKFFDRLTGDNRTLADVTIEDIDSFIESLAGQGWCRVSVAKSVKVLRTFFRYAEHRGWCKEGIAEGIIGPRIFRDEGVPMGPEWCDVEHLIRSTDGVNPGDIRDKAILLLLAVYGLRRSEVTSLRLEDLNWYQDRITITRPKQRCSQEYPLLPSVGNSILHYLEHARQKSTYSEVFLTLRAPIRPLSSQGLSTMVVGRMRALGIRSLHHGPHALRHACAGRLVAQGLSLKEIGDHLGHRSTSATRIYAKVDIDGLRTVADFSLGGLL